MIKLSILANEYNCDTLYVDQQPDLSMFYKSLMPNPTHTILLQKGDLNDRFSYAIKEISKKIKNYDTVIVQGDTLTATAGALAAFNLGIKIAHVEAGLRTNDITSPFPEEAYRAIISRISNWNFCPTEISKKNLEKENIPGSCFLTGNTVIDLVSKLSINKNSTYENIIIVTLHRRENINHLNKILNELKNISNKLNDYKWIFPIHPNPEVKEKVEKILQNSKIQLVDPFDYPDFIDLIRKCKLIITDSGGIQEEAAFFKKRVVICRKNTERPEGIHAGFAVLGFNNIEHLIFEALKMPIWQGDNPYGNGKSSEIIANLLNFSQKNN
jgi:UDP-N-acetylglucosamine 2-epimerase (non-hydrolysing)